MDAEPMLIPLEDQRAIEQAERSMHQMGDYTGARLWRDRPAIYRSVVRALAEGCSYRAIARAYSVAYRTVRAVAKREGVTIATDKQELGEVCITAARAGAERLAEEIDSVPLNVLPTAIGILTDKALLLNEQATQIVDVRVREDLRPEAINAYIASLPEAQIEELPAPETGAGTGESGAKEGGSADGVEGGTVDCDLSGERMCDPLRDGANGRFATGDATGSGDQGGEGEGVALEEAGGGVGDSATSDSHIGEGAEIFEAKEASTDPPRPAADGGQGDPGTSAPVVEVAAAGRIETERPAAGPEGEGPSEAGSADGSPARKKRGGARRGGARKMKQGGLFDGHE